MKSNIILKLASGPGAFGAVHYLAHVQAKGVSWCVLTEGLTGGRHTPFDDFQAAKACFDALTTPIEATT